MIRKFILSLICFFIVNKLGAQPAHMRVVAKTHSKYIGSAFKNADSAFYSYSGPHEGNLDINPVQMEFDASATFMWNNSSWNPVFRQTQSFDTKGRPQKIINETYNSGWSNASQLLYSYDASGNVFDEITQYWQSGSWVNSDRILYTYSNKLLQVDSQHWAAGAWQPAQKRMYTYIGVQLSEITSQNWNSTIWTNAYKHTYNYNISSQVISDVYRWWNAGNNTWEDFQRFTTSYDGSNDPVTKIEEHFTSGAYTNFQKTSITFNGHQRIADETKQWNGSTWAYTTGSSRNDYYYEIFQTGVARLIKNEDLHIYPIPTSSLLHVRIDNRNHKIGKLMLADMQGRTLIQTQGTVCDNLITMQVAEIPNGNYILKIDLEGESGTAQICVHH